MKQLDFSNGAKSFSLLLPYTVMIINSLTRLRAGDLSKIETVQSSESYSKGVQSGVLFYTLPFLHNQNSPDHRYRVSLLNFPMFQEMYKVQNLQSYCLWLILTKTRVLLSLYSPVSLAYRWKGKGY